MAESEFQEGNYDGREQKGKLQKDLEELLEKVEDLTVRATCLLFDYTTISTNPDLINNTQHLQDAFLRCKGHIEKKGQEVLMESRGEGKNGNKFNLVTLAEQHPLENH